MFNLFCSARPKNKKNKLLPTYALVVGHTEKKPGAMNYVHKLSEFMFNDFLARRCNELYESSNYCYYDDRDILIPLKDIFNLDIVYRTTLRELPKTLNKLNPKAIISLHCNAFNLSVSGTETLYADESVKGRTLAKVLQNFNVSTLGLKNRGLKAIDIEDRGGYILFHTKAPCVISEPFFLDNGKDMTVGLDKIDELAENLLKSFLFLEELPTGVII